MVDFVVPLQGLGNQPVNPNGFAREAILPFWHQAGCLAGGLVAWWHTSWRPLGLAICIFEGLGTVDVKMHGFKVPKSAYFNVVGLRKTWLKYSKYQVIVTF